MPVPKSPAAPPKSPAAPPKSPKPPKVPEERLLWLDAGGKLDGCGEQTAVVPLSGAGPEAVPLACCLPSVCLTHRLLSHPRAHLQRGARRRTGSC